MRVLGGLLVLGLAYVTGSQEGVLGFFAAWAIITIFVMGSAIAVMLLSLPLVARSLSAALPDDVEPSKGDAEGALRDLMSFWTYIGAFIGIVLGTIVASMVL